MNVCQLSFGKEPQIQEIEARWQAIGLLTVQDNEKRENTFRVLVSGANKDIFLKFIALQESDCSIKLEVGPWESPLVDSIKPPVNEDSSPFILEIPESQLRISISPLDIQTPKPCQITYHIAMKTIDSAKGYDQEPLALADECGDRGHTTDDTEINLGALLADMDFAIREPKYKKTDREITFNSLKARVQCTVTKGIVTVCLKEKLGNEFEKRCEPQELPATNKPVWVPEKALDPIGEDKLWLVEITGEAAENTIEVNYNEIINNNYAPNR